MSPTISIKELRERISTSECVDPLIFLESIVSGQDPRVVSQLFDLVEEIQEFTGGSPDKADWKQLYTFVNEEIKYRSPTISESLSAAKALSEYLHPKRKQVEITGNTAGGIGKVEPLTIEDIKLFRERWDEEY